MAWQIKLTPAAEKQLGKLDVQVAQRILKYLKDRVAQDPRASGNSLQGHLREFWRYRVGDYRVLAKIQDDHLLILVVQVGHRSKVYEHQPATK